jgi:PAS domain S-box-containing protein
MLEHELFALLEHTGDAAYTVTAAGEICSWNRAAERLFGYSADEVLHRKVNSVFGARDALGTDALAGGRDAATRHLKAASRGLPNFDLEVDTRAGVRVWVNVSTILYEDPRTGRQLFIRLARDITQRKREEALFAKMLGLSREVVALTADAADHAPVATLTEQERRILRRFAAGDSSTAVARGLRISPQTLRNHLHRINRKLRTHTRLEAVTHALRRGLLD